MRLTGFLLLAAALHVSATGTSQKVTLSLDHVPVQKVFAEVFRQTGISIVYTESMFKDFSPVTIHMRDASPEEVLDKCLKDQPFAYSMEGSMIVIKKKVSPPAVADSSFSSPPPIDIHGHITDSSGAPLAGASVTIRGTKTGTTTDVNGNFELRNAKENVILIISYTGYTTKQIKTNGHDLTVLLSKSNSPLDEIQVIAYGEVSKRFQTGNVTTVKGEDIAKQPVSNPLLALEGRVPGLFITQVNGLPGSAVIVRLQGQNSILNGNDPLYVIDGVPFTSQLLPTTTGGPLGSSGAFSNGTSLQGNPLSYINPSDIESIDVLKDADATAIYGSRAANGAILITTKKGKIGQTKGEINLQQGWGHITRKINLLNTQQYLEMRHEAFRNNGATPDSNYDYDLTLWDTTRNTDWQKIFIGGTSQYTNVNASVSGGTSVMQYLVGGTFHRETTIFPGNFDDKKGSLHFNINSQSINQKFHLQLTGNYLIDNNLLPQTDLTASALNLAPDAPALHNPDGTLNWMVAPSGASSWYNPLAGLYNTYQNKTNNLISNLVLGYKLFNDIEIKSSFGYTSLQTNEFAPSPLIAYKPEQRSSNTSSALYSNSTINSWIIEPQAFYKRNIGKGRLDFLIGTTIQQNNSNGQALAGVGYNSDAVLANILSATTIVPVSSVASVYKYNAAFGRLSYNWDSKYLLNFSVRRDGSSRFGSQNRFHNFGSIAGAWIFTQESFIQNNLPFLDFGKLRGSFGTTGNDQIGDYQNLNLYSPNIVGVPYQNTTGLVPNGLSNPYLQWEETKKIQFGLDLSFYKERILLTANYVHNQSSNQLLSYGLPIITGFYTVNKNFPATVQNTAWELSLTTTNIKTRNFSWTSNINLTIPRNKLISFPDLASSSYSNSLIVGQPVTILKKFHQIGVNDSTGIYEFADSKGSPTYNPSYTTDQTAIIDRAPRYYGGFQNSFSYKGFHLDFLFQFVKQIGASYAYTFIPGVYIGGSVNGYNQPVSVLSRWQKPGDKSNIERFSSDFSTAGAYSYSAGSDAAFTDASFIRLKNLSFSWELPKSLLQKTHLQGCRIFMQGQNLLTITHYAGMDPENQGTVTLSLPPQKVLTVGFQMGL